MPTTAQKLHANGQPYDEWCVADAVAQVVPMEVARHVDALVRPRRQRVERHERRHRRFANPPRPRTTRARQSSASEPPLREHAHQRDERLLALAANAEVHTAVAQADVGVLRREVAAPDDRHTGMRAVAAAREASNGVLQLRARHHGDADGGQRAPVSDRGDARDRIRLDVAVDDLVVELAFEQRADGEQRHRQRLLRRRRAPGVEQDDHDAPCVSDMPTLPTSADEAARTARA